MWIAKDEHNRVYLFNNKPDYEVYNEHIPDTGYWYYSTDGSDSRGTRVYDSFDDLTFENSPKKVIIITEGRLEEEFDKGVKYATKIALQLIK